MAVEYSAPALQTVAANSNILFTASNPECGVRSIDRRAGSGLVELRGATNQCRAQYIAMFSANIAIPVGGTVGEISAAITINGEPLPASTMIVTTAAIGDLWNVSTNALIDVSCGCCVTISVRNTSAQAIDVQNANLIVERKA